MAEGWDFERLASRRAIVFADLVESVRLFAGQQVHNVERWHRFCDQVRHVLVPGLGGRVVRTLGDGLLLDFASADAATRASFELHRELARGNPPQPGPDTMCLRIGLHLDDVVAEHQDLWGGGVNLAARLATVAQPGQTVASAALRSALGDGVQADIHDLGLRYLKNLPEPERAFQLIEPGQPRGAHLPSTEDIRPAIAVVPFMALPADAEHDALGHAMADDIIASLARHPGLRVLSRASTAVVRGQALELKRLRELLGAGFLLTGQFFVRGTRVRLNAELCELGQGQVLWTASTHGDVDALFEGQDELVPHIVSQVSQQVLAHELGRVRSLPMDSLASYSLFLGASGLLHSLAAAPFGQARDILEHLVERHPRQASPHALLSGWHIVRMIQGWSDDVAADRQQALTHASRAMDKDPQQPAALVAQGMAMVFAKGDFEGAAQLYQQALATSPHFAEAWARLSETQSQAGAHDEALGSARRAIACSPLDPQRYAFESFAARAAYVAQHFQPAAAHARAAIQRHALHAPAHRLLIAALWQAGEQPAAHEAVGNYLRLMPGARAHAGGGSGPSPFTRVLECAGVPP